ncbi:predicted protein [Histoplasma capsulatum G186AR]|uniref:Uncharacterized protein n=1 Tax=Ajellomyces capsulatus (strain G186AR / H82 / ATCC MYA-2454 / RMSCC 2432) TaxID=447093 RepID=C0NWT9_AJECG|nr:uncharacterized protein HCBG_07619 [Histoplasma capsulatum G186AR]EEH04394.1 predicted protein [Histoplasma capsulatum G186AR]
MGRGWHIEDDGYPFHSELLWLEGSRISVDALTNQTLGPDSGSFRFGSGEVCPLREVIAKNKQHYLANLELNSGMKPFATLGWSVFGAIPTFSICLKFMVGKIQSGTS